MGVPNGLGIVIELMQNWYDQMAPIYSNPRTTQSDAFLCQEKGDERILVQPIIYVHPFSIMRDLFYSINVHPSLA